jgi:hypothetical protein
VLNPIVVHPRCLKLLGYLLIHHFSSPIMQTALTISVSVLPLGGFACWQSRAPPPLVLLQSNELAAYFLRGTPNLID